MKNELLSNADSNQVINMTDIFQVNDLEIIQQKLTLKHQRSSSASGYPSTVGRL